MARQHGFDAMGGACRHDDCAVSGHNNAGLVVMRLAEQHALSHPNHHGQPTNVSQWLVG